MHATADHGIMRDAVMVVLWSMQAQNPLVFVCGPPGLAAIADLACLKNKVSFHKEVFAY